MTQTPYTAGGLKPHRGGLVLGLGIGGIVLSICCALIGLILSIVAIVFARGDLAAMQRGEMDPAGLGKTKGGMICGIVGIILSIINIIVGIILAVTGNSPFQP